MLTPQSNIEFSKARQRAFVEDWLSYLTGRPSDLLSFEEIRQNLRLQDAAYRGLHEIELDKIVGSTGRYRDFTRTFLPKSDGMSQRWRQVNTAVNDLGVPPIEVYKVGDVYFVRDGNHRVSVAHMNKAKTIEAYVIEYKTSVPIDQQDNLDDILMKTERTEFFEETRLDTLRPGHNLLFTEPGRYRLVKEHIAFHKYLKEIETGHEIPYEEAVGSWYDHVYMPLIDLIRERDVLSYFPDRTEADLYAWLILHRAELEKDARSLGYISDNELLEELIKEKNATALTRLLSFFTPKLDLQSLSLKAARTKFLEETGLNTIRPNHGLRFTEPACYFLAKEHIDVHKYLKETETGFEMPYPEAVASWYDTVYRPTVQLIREHEVLNYYADNTEADLYMWLVSRRAAIEHEQHTLGQVSTEDIIEDFEQESLNSPVTRMIGYLRQKLDTYDVPVA